MARQTITPVSVTNPYPTGLTSLAFTACHATDKEQTPLTGKEVLIFYNSSADTDYWVTITSVASARLGNRTGHITQIDIPFGTYRVIGPLAEDGWRQSDGYLYTEAENAAIKMAVLRIP